MHENIIKEDLSEIQKTNQIAVNSRICIEDIDTGEEFVFRLVSHERLNVKRNKISTLTPLGKALLGHKTGNIVRWQSPTRLRNFKVRSVCYSHEFIEKLNI